MKTVFRGDAVAVSQITHVTPANVQIGDVFTLSINGKSISYTADAATVADVTKGLTAAWTTSKIPEFTEVTAADGQTHLILTAKTAGVPFRLTATTTNTTAATLASVAETIRGVVGIDEIQEITFDGTYTGGTFTITFSGQTTAAIAYNASAATVQTALEALSNIAVGDVAVTGNAGDWFVRFQGAYDSTDVPLMTVDGSSLTGTNLVVTNTTQEGFAGADAIQWLDTAGVKGGTYTLSLDGQTTVAIPAVDSEALIQSALEGLSNVGAGNVVVTGVPWPDKASTPGTAGGTYLIRFQAALGGQAVSLLAIDRSLLQVPSQAGVVIQQTGGEASFDAFQFIKLGSGDSDSTYSLTFTTGGIQYSAGPIAYKPAAFMPTGPGGIGYGSLLFHAGPYSAYEQIVHSITLQYIAAGIVTEPEAAAKGSYVALASFLDLIVTVDNAAGDVTQGFWIRHKTNSLAGTSVLPFVMATAGIKNPTQTVGVTRVVDGGSGTGDEIQTIKVQGSGGTFTLTYDGQTTAAIAYGATAAAVDTALELLSNIGVGDVAVTGMSPNYTVTFGGALAAMNVALITGDGTSLTGGSATVITTTAAVSPVNEQQTITLGDDVNGGTFTLSFNGQGPTAAIAYNAAAATIKTALEALSNIDLVSVTGSGPWVVTFGGVNAGTNVALMTADGTNLTTSTGTQTATVAEITRSAGPNHWDSPRNWTLNQIPDSGDEVILDALDVEILYGIVQRVDFTADAATDTLTFVSVADFREDQIVRVRNSGGALPGGLAAATDYYVINLDRDAMTCQLSATKAGAAINLTSAGTGTHTIGVELDAITIGQRYVGKLGLPQRNELEYFEYRSIYLAIGLSDPVGGTNRAVLVGTDDGAGSGRLRLDLRGSVPDVEVVETGGSTEPGVPALLLLIDQAAANLVAHAGEIGIAKLPAETAVIGTITQHGGTIEMGEVTVTDITRNEGTLTGQKITMAGQLIARG